MSNKMAHADEVFRVLREKEIPTDKILISSNDTVFYDRENKNIYQESAPWGSAPGESLPGFEKYKFSLLATNSDKLMEEFRSRVKGSEKTILYVYDNAPTFFPAIKGNVFEMIKVVFVKKK